MNLEKREKKRVSILLSNDDCENLEVRVFVIRGYINLFLYIKIRPFLVLESILKSLGHKLEYFQRIPYWYDTFISHQIDFFSQN